MSTTPELTTMRASRAEIDLAAFRRNVDAIIGMIPDTSRLVAVLKADAYGHGAVELARQLDERVPMIAVALLEEAMELRAAAVPQRILILGVLDRPQMLEAIANDVEIAVPSPESLAAACELARDRDVAIHLKLDSGMGRTGLLESDLPAAIEMIRSASRLSVASIYTHFANAPDPNDPFTQTQVETFDRLLGVLRDAGIDAPLHHLANSGATVRGLVRDGDWARVGIALFGAETLDDHSMRLEPVLRWRTEVVRVKTLPAGHGVGYSLTYRTTGETRVATIAVGYADGYNRLLSNRGEVLVHGKRAPVIGRVSMDLVTIDVSGINDVAVGDEVVLLGRGGDQEISAEEVAGWLGTISYEVLCAVGARVPRIYRDGESLVAVRSRFGK